MDQSLEAFLSDFKQQAQWPDCFVVGYSGGVDSTALLHALHSRGLPVHAVHVNHGLQAQAGDWALHCQQYCVSMGIPFTCLVVKVDAGGQGVEGQARTARYRAILNWMKQLGHRVLLCAHHQDDQLETILLQLLRGSGLRGVGGMRRLGSVGVDRHLHPEILLGRPLLACSKVDINRYAKLHGLAPIHDPSNSDTRFRRNWVRHELLPQLLAHFPQSPTALQALADFFQAHYDREDLETAAAMASSVQADGILQLSSWQQLSETEQLNSLRQWLLAHGVRCGRLKLIELARQLRISKGGIRTVEKGWQVQVSRQQARLQHTHFDKDSGFEQQ